MGYGVHGSGELSGEFVIERAGEDIERWIDCWNTKVVISSEQHSRRRVSLKARKEARTSFQRWLGRCRMGGTFILLRKRDGLLEYERLGYKLLLRFP